MPGSSSKLCATNQDLPMSRRPMSRRPLIQASFSSRNIPQGVHRWRNAELFWKRPASRLPPPASACQPRSPSRSPCFSLTGSFACRSLVDLSTHDAPLPPHNLYSYLSRTSKSQHISKVSPSPRVSRHLEHELTWKTYNIPCRCSLVAFMSAPAAALDLAPSLYNSYLLVVQARTNAARSKANTESVVQRV